MMVLGAMGIVALLSGAVLCVGYESRGVRTIGYIVVFIGGLLVGLAANP
jgi:Na+/phosphate symporter